MAILGPLHPPSACAEAPTPSRDPRYTAFTLADLGLFPFPLRDHDPADPSAFKRPREKGWQEQAERATAEDYSKWDAAGYNYGLHLGLSDLVVLDTDTPEAEAEAQRRLPPTPWTQKTAKGFHRFYRLPELMDPPKNNKPLPGMDRKASGGYILAPGSWHFAAGVRYEPVGDWEASIDELPFYDPAWFPTDSAKGKAVSIPAPARPIAPLSEKLVADDRGKVLKRAVAQAGKLKAGVSGEAGHNTTFEAALKLAIDFALTEDELFDVMNVAYNPRCEPPWSEPELRHKCHDAYEGSLSAANRGRLQPHAIGEDCQPIADLLHRGNKGQLLPVGANLTKILRLHQQWGNRLTLNEMSQEVCHDRDPKPEHFADGVQEWLQDQFGMNFPTTDIKAKLRAQAAANPFHPVREYLNGLPVWDREDRLSRVPTEILHADDLPLYQKYFVNFAVGAVRRVMDPGCKLDSVLVLAGPQGVYKSSVFAVLAGPWFNDSPIELGAGKDAYMVLHRAWISELGEIDHTTSTVAMERLKGFLASRRDMFRPPYAASVGTFPRSCVLVGSTNREGFLTDHSGSRRFWPIKVNGPAELDRLTLWRDQLWAQAVHLEASGVPHWLDESDELVRAEDASRFDAEDPWEALVMQATTNMFADRPQLPMSIATIMERMEIPVTQQSRALAMRVAAILTANGWVKRQVRVGKSGRKVWEWSREEVFQPISHPAALTCLDLPPQVKAV